MLICNDKNPGGNAKHYHHLAKKLCITHDRCYLTKKRSNKLSLELNMDNKLEGNENNVLYCSRKVNERGH